MRKDSKTFWPLVFILALAFDLWLWWGIFSQPIAASQVYFLDVGQGDSELITLPSAKGKTSIKILIDGGRDDKVLSALEPIHSKYLDLIIATHPDVDHFGGLIDVIKHYQVGLFISNGETNDSATWQALEQTLDDYSVPRLVLGAGDTIDYGDNELLVISPDATLLADGDDNEASLVLKLDTAGTKTLFTADAGLTAEQHWLTEGVDLQADILKVGHHGSKNSSSPSFLAAVQPAISAISVGQNSYGHPSPNVIDNLAALGSEIYRTDEQGTIHFNLSSAEKPNQSTGFLTSLAAVLTGSYRDKTGGSKTLTLNDLATAREQQATARAANPLARNCQLGQIDLNRADKTDLVRLRHIGEARAEQIIASRPFQRVSDLGRINGIGNQRLTDIINENLACAGL